MANVNPFALATLFRGSALHGGLADEWSSEALHLRVHVHPLLGVPLHPFVAHRFRAFTDDAMDIVWMTLDGRILPAGEPFNPANEGGTVLGRIVGVDGERVPPDWCWIHLEAVPNEPDFRIDVLARETLPDGTDRVLATRRDQPFEFGGLEIGRLRAQGNGDVRPGGRGVLASRLDITGFEGPPPVRFGLRTELGPWYDPGPDPEGEVDERLRRGLPRQPGPPDDPNRAGGGVDPDAEVGRVLGTLGPELVDPWVRTALGDPGVPPGEAIVPEEQVVNGVAHTTTIRAVDGLLTMSVDPEIARYLGFSTAVDPARAELEPGANIWLIGGRWVARPDRPIDRRGTTLRQWLDARPEPFWLAPYLDREFPDAAGIASRVADENAGLPPEEAWSVVTLFTAAVAAGDAPPDVPDRLEPEVRTSGTWNPGPGATTWTQPITLPGRAAEGPLGFARLDPGGLVSLHAMNPGGRAATILAPWSARGDRVATPSGLVLRRRERTVTDGDVPPDRAEVFWAIWQADEWGRWSEPADARADRPPRPAPPPPELEVWLRSSDRDGPPGDRSPGTLELRVRLPKPAALAPGARPVTRVVLASDQVVSWQHAGTTTAGTTTSFSVGPGSDEPEVVEAVVTTTPVGGRIDVLVTAWSEDADGVPSEPRELRRPVHDPRRPPPVVTAPRILWSGQPDPTGRSELALRWRAGGGAQFRVYLGDERRLARALGLAVDPVESRATRARRIWERSRDLTAKDEFTLLTEQPLVEAGGEVVFRERLPGTLRGVQFVRVVPVSAGGLEAVFGECPLVPIAIPTGDAPSVPALRVAPADGGRIDVRVEARGLRSDVVASAATGPPAFRVRRTRGGATEALYMPVVHEGSLEEIDGLWTGSWVDGANAPLPDFVTHTYVAEVRYPPEPDLAAGAEPVDDPLAIRPAWATTPGPVPSAWSSASTPASTALIPSDPPPAPTGVTFAVDASGAADVTIPSPPIGHRSGTPFSALIVRETAGGALETLPAVELMESPAVIHDPSAGRGYRVAFIDPVGRVGPLAVAASSP